MFIFEWNVISATANVHIRMQIQKCAYHSKHSIASHTVCPRHAPGHSSTVQVLRKQSASSIGLPGGRVRQQAARRRQSSPLQRKQVKPGHPPPPVLLDGQDITRARKTQKIGSHRAHSRNVPASPRVGGGEVINFVCVGRASVSDFSS